MTGQAAQLKMSPQGLGAAGGSQYQLALRHSRRVRRLKIALPAASFLLVAGFLVVSFLATQLPDGVTVTSASIEDGKLVMYRPTLTGENENQQKL